MPPPPQGPVQMAVGPGLLCKAGSPKAGQQRNNKMDSLLLKTRKLATSHGCQSLQPIEGRQHQDEEPWKEWKIKASVHLWIGGHPLTYHCSWEMRNQWLWNQAGRHHSQDLDGHEGI
ncbi:uncharacterized protein LOC135320871 isoform X2 [Camelus dromedarius]|uniref:Uncharacterized protein LOC141577079 isoform X3 n=1 Tax=Camelus bactrianus TaxID=9837 RepID=A0AC58Q382_CAMBA